MVIGLNIKKDMVNEYLIRHKLHVRNIINFKFIILAFYCPNFNRKS